MGMAQNRGTNFDQQIGFQWHGAMTSQIMSIYSSFWNDMPEYAQGFSKFRTQTTTVSVSSLDGFGVTVLRNPSWVFFKWTFQIHTCHGLLINMGKCYIYIYIWYIYIYITFAHVNQKPIVCGYIYIYIPQISS